jgi:hypothetical protein
MRRSALLAVAAAALSVGSPALAKFGISKTRVTLPRLKPPEVRVLAGSLAVEVRSSTSEVSGSHVSLVRGRLEEAIAGSRLFQLVPRARDADALVRLTLDALSAEVRDEVEMESRYVKIGEKEVWNEKKKKYETENVYGNRDEPVSYRVAEGSLSATLEIQAEDGSQTRDAGASYSQRFKKDGSVPAEARSEEALRRFLVDEAAGNAVGLVAYGSDPVEVLLAVDGELKPGNRLAEEGHFDSALVEWQRKTYKGDKEAARQHNVGVAHEALAYGFRPHTPEHLAELQKAREFYRSARELDSGEKYFKDPLERIERSLRYAEAAAQLRAELDHFSQSRSAREEAPAEPAPPPPAPVARPAAAAPPPAAPRPAAAPPKPVKPAAPPAPVLEAPPQVPLRNGSFEASLAPWTVAGPASVVSEPGRGRVLEIKAGQGSGHALQAVGVPLDAGATLSLAYKVMAGESRIRLLVGYLDSGGRPRTATLEVTAGEGPGGWSPWSTDLAALRPRPARFTEIKAVVEGGTARIDNVALTTR